MADNVLMKITQSIDAVFDFEGVRVLLESTLDNIDRVYSYIIFAVYDDSILTGYTIQFNVSQMDRYNTLHKDSVIEDVMKILRRKNSYNKNVIGYGQPSAKIMLEVYDPLVNKLARMQDGKWSLYTHEDLCQICRYEMLNLYNKGYYIHKRLVEKAFINRILMDNRHEKYCPGCVSFEDTFYRTSSSDSEKLSVADTIPDEQLIEQERNKDIEEAEKAIYEEVKDIIVDLIGIRRWNELVRSYTTKNTTTTTRKIMQQIKAHFEQLGITRKDFNRRYYD